MSQVVSFTDYTPAARYDDSPWTAVRVQEGETDIGPWALIDTITLDPVDSDPAHPRSRNITTSNASDEPSLWYRLVFTDDDDNLSQPSSPVQNVSLDTIAFAPVDDLAVRLGLELTSDEEARALELLVDASNLIRRAAGQTLSLVEDDVLTRPGTNDAEILLPQRPVRVISSVTLDGAELVEGTDWRLDGNKLVRLGGMGTLRLDDRVLWGRRGFGTRAQTLEIVYTHGYENPVEPARSICLEAVVRVWVNPGTVAQERVGDTSTLYTTAGAPSGLLLTTAEERALRRAFGRTATSITIG